MLGYDISSALKSVKTQIENPEADDDLNIKDTKKLLEFGSKLKLVLSEVWKEPSSDVFSIGSQEEVQRIDELAEELGSIQSLRNSFNKILIVVLGSLDASLIFMRTKALKALGQIVTSDSTILSAVSVIFFRQSPLIYITRPMSAMVLKAICWIARRKFVMLPSS